MEGTLIRGISVTKVIDGDTIKVSLNGKDESIRLAVVDTEESQPGGDKPVTKAGLAAAAMAKHYFSNSDNSYAQIDLQFDTADPVEQSLDKHRDNYGRLLAYVLKQGENFNLKLVREGWSPYFVKYGRSRLYHSDFLNAEAQAQANDRVIWNEGFNAGGPTRDYQSLLPWWGLRDAIVEEYRRAAGNKVLSVRLDYQKILAAAAKQQTITVFCDLQAGVQRWLNDSALIFAGSKFHRFDLKIPDIYSDSMADVIRLIQKRYAGQARGYVYVQGKVSLYKDDTPEMIISDIKQLTDVPPDAG